MRAGAAGTGGDGTGAARVVEVAEVLSLLDPSGAETVLEVVIGADLVEKEVEDLVVHALLFRPIASSMGEIKSPSLDIIIQENVTKFSNETVGKPY